MGRKRSAGEREVSKTARPGLSRDGPTELDVREPVKVLMGIILGSDDNRAQGFSLYKRPPNGFA